MSAVSKMRSRKAWMAMRTSLGADVSSLLRIASSRYGGTAMALQLSLNSNSRSMPSGKGLSLAKSFSF